MFGTGVTGTSYYHTRNAIFISEDNLRYLKQTRTMTMIISLHRDLE